MRFVKALLLLVALQSPALAQTDGVGLAAGAKAAADQLQLYLDDVAKSGGRPDFGEPRAAELLARIFDVQHLNALPPPQVDDIPWLLDWAAAASKAGKAIMFFGLKPPADPTAPALARNVLQYQDQQAIGSDFLIRIAARESSAMLAFWQQLTPEMRTPIREAGLKKARFGFAQLIYGALCSMADAQFKPANARRLSAAMRDTVETWAGFIAADNRAQIMIQLQRTQFAVKDDEAQENLAGFGAVLAAGK
jgi:hypothetical protein